MISSRRDFRIRIQEPKRLVIVDGIRTPFSKMGSALSGLAADELGRIATSALMAKTGIDPQLIDEVIFGCVGQPADAANVSRVIALRSGISKSVPAITVHRNCASGCEAITQAYEKMMAGRGDVFLVGGCESMSQYPLLYSQRTSSKFGKLMRARSLTQKLSAASRFRPKDFLPRISLQLGLTDPTCGMNMGQTAELIGRENGITREMQDQFASRSHTKALAAKSKLAEEITPAYIGPDYRKMLMADDGVRSDSTIERLARLKPFFEKRTGTVTAGNSSQVTDGAVAMLVMSETKAKELGMEPLGFLSGYAYAACDPSRMGLGPVYAINRAEEITGLKLSDADLIEINEAFAAQVLACTHLMADETFCKTELGRPDIIGEVPEEKLNVNGGSIALGHPVGATGARLALSTLLELRRRGKRRGLITACVGGGQGVAVWLEATQ